MPRAVWAGIIAKPVGSAAMTASAVARQLMGIVARTARIVPRVANVW